MSFSDDDSSTIDERMAKIRPYVEQLDPQCQIIINWSYYLAYPPDIPLSEVLIKQLGDQGYHLKHSSLPTVISRCKRKLREIILADWDNFIASD